MRATLNPINLRALVGIAGRPLLRWVSALAAAGLLALAGCGQRQSQPDDFFILRHPDLGEGTAVVAATQIICSETVGGEIRLGDRWGSEVWLDGKRVHARILRKPRATRLDDERIPIALDSGSHDLVLRFLNGPAPAIDSTRTVKTDAGLVIRFTDGEGKALRGLDLVARGGEPGDTWSVAAGDSVARGARDVPSAGDRASRTLHLDPVPVVMSVEEIRDYPLTARVKRSGKTARIALDWSRAFPDTVRRFRLERTASWHHRLPVEWSVIADTIFASSFSDSIPLDPGAWPWHSGTGMGRILTYRVTTEPHRQRDWMAPRLVSALVLAPGFHDLESATRKLEDAAAAHPDLITLERIGESAWGNHAILAARVTAPAGATETSGASKPAVLVVGHIHTREPFGIEIALDLVSNLSAEYGRDAETTRLLDQAELWVVPTMNPGGWAHLSAGFPSYMRKNLADVNGDGVPTPAPLYPIKWDSEPLLASALDTVYLEGIDLNRNFAPHWELTTADDSGSPVPGKHKYRGPEPFSEPETRAIRDLALRERFVFSLFYHEPGDRLYFLKDTLDEDLFTQLADRLARASRKRPGDWSGCSLAFMYLEAGTIEFTVEGATHARGDAEWLLAPRAANRDSVSAHHQEIVRKLLRLAAHSGLHGRVIDGRTRDPIAAPIEIWRTGEKERRRAHTDTARTFHRYLLPGVYSVAASAPGRALVERHGVEIAADNPTWIEIVLD